MKIYTYVLVAIVVFCFGGIAEVYRSSLYVPLSPSDQAIITLKASPEFQKLTDTMARAIVAKHMSVELMDSATGYAARSSADIDRVDYMFANLMATSTK